MPTRLVFSLLIAAFVSLPPLARAASPFDTCSARTGNNATVIVPVATASINGEALEMGDQMAVFTPDGVCAGYTVWEGEHAVLVAWEDSPMTTVTEGFGGGEELMYVIWDASADALHNEVSVRYEVIIAESEDFETDAIYVVSELKASGSVSSESGAASTFTLGSNYPNPFTSRTTIQYELATQSEVYLEVFNAVGRRVAVLVDGVKAAGAHEASLDTRNDLASGVYFYRLRAGGFTATQKMTIVG